MLSIDTNILLHAFSQASPLNKAARTWLTGLVAREDVILSEFVLAELHLLLRNPTILERPLAAPEAVEVIQQYRSHPRWKIAGFPPNSLELHQQLWRYAGTRGLARRAIYDARMVFCLRAFGVTDFATANIKDFTDLGFARVWNPLTETEVSTSDGMRRD